MGKGNASWMKASFGISSHWTSHCVNLDGKRPAYDEAVAHFDVERYAETLASVGVRHCIFTLTHAEQKLPLPHPVLEKLLPGRTAKRDLVGDLIAALGKRGIRFIAYYNHSCNGEDDPPWKKACGYADGVGGDLDLFAGRICEIVSFMSRRYGTGIAGWWFDSAYSVDPRGPVNTISCDLGDWRFPWASLVSAARCGNPESAVAINAGVGTHFLYHDDVDYYAGESVAYDQDFAPPPRTGIQDHRWTCLDSPAWVFGRHICSEGFIPPRFTDGEIRNYVRDHLDAGRMVTFNVLIDADGTVNPNALAHLKSAGLGA